MYLVEVSNAVELWELFEQTAKLDDTFYDEALKDDIYRVLAISPVDGDAKQLLIERSISTERLLAAILTSMQPFSRMLDELLSLFERIGAQRSDGGLCIEFDFDEGKRFGIDLDSFRRDIIRVERCLYHAPLPTDPWRFYMHLCDILTQQEFWSEVVGLDFLRDKVLYRDIFRWIDRARGVRQPSLSNTDQGNKAKYHMHFPDCPHGGNAMLDTKLEVLWKLAELSWCHYLDVESSNINPDGLYYAETDHWSERMVGLVTEIAYFISSIDASRRLATAERITEAIGATLELHGCGADIPVTVYLEQLEAFLELPYWKRRHELYSAWVLTQIDKALEGMGTRYFVRDGVLSFSFKGVCLATCALLSPSPLIYAELRSKLDNPIGPGRKSGIQPDYTIAMQPVREPDNALAVVECKQYKRASRKAFEAALVDYANGRPKALVSLVNYGKVPDQGNIPTNIQLRTALYGLMRPYTDEARRFREDLRTAIRTHYRNGAVGGGACTYPWKEPGVSCSIRLSWNSSPHDLDLHARIADMSIDAYDKEAQEIYYRCLEHPEGWKYGRLDGDQRKGPGSETLQIEEWYPEGRYDIYVVNYSGEVAVEGNVTVTLHCGETEVMTIERNEWDSKMVWHVFRLSGFGLQVINQMVNQVVR